jgi:hypothetical protein
MTKEEILNLSNLTEEEQIQWLVKHEIPTIEQHMCEICCRFTNEWESLADLAFRLRDEINKNSKGYDNFAGGLREIYILVNGDSEPKPNLLVYTHFWLTQAKPIHWIQAALLARIEK